MERHQGLMDLVATRTPACVIETEWARPIRLSCYVGAADLPAELVVSVRCFVLVGDDVVVCTNLDGFSHAWPGGRVEPGESFAETACREVHEETGWLLDASTIEPIGFNHFLNLGDPLPPFPHPDALHLVVVARATSRAADDWTDSEGYELSSRLVPLVEAAAAVDELEAGCIPFLEDLVARQTGRAG